MIKACVVCGTGFDARGKALACGAVCKKERRVEQRKSCRGERNHTERKRRAAAKIPSTCAVCGTAFEARTSGKVCGIECRRTLDRANAAKRRANNPDKVRAARSAETRQKEKDRAKARRAAFRVTHSEQTRVCAECELVFTLPWRSRAVTCGAECRVASAKKKNADWRSKNISRVRACAQSRAARYRANDPEKYRSRSRAAYWKNIEQSREQSRNSATRHRITLAQIATRQAIAQMGLD